MNSIKGLFTVLSLYALLSVANAQEPEGAQQATDEAASAQENRAAAEAELHAAGSAMREAQRRLQDAAREIARLSAQRFSPNAAFKAPNVVVAPNWRFAYDRNRPTLGIVIENADEGVLVTGVTPNGPADNAGVQTGDVISEISGESVGAREAGDNPTEWLLGVLGRSDPGDTVSLVVMRAGEPISVDIETQATPWGVPDVSDLTMPGMEAFRRFNVFDGGRWRDMELVELSPALGEYFGTEEGLLVVSAPEDETLGLVDGDVILEIGGRTPTSTAHAMRILASFERGETLTLTIMRQQRRRDIEIELE